MGTYVWYSGMADYPLEKRKRIKENILKMLDAGGMMQIESVKNNNHELYVLSKPEKDQNNRILWNFNYFEDDMWETASLDCKDLQIYSNKVGNEEYKDVMIHRRIRRVYSPFSYKNIQEKLSMINVGGGCGEFVIINMNEIRRK